MSKEYIIINPAAAGGVAITITASYGRVSIANAIRKDPRKEHSSWKDEQKVLEQVKKMCEGRRGGRGGATLEADGTIRGNYNVGTHDSSISEMIIQHEDNPALTLTTSHAPKCYGESTGWRIRKLTPTETGRLMGLHDDEIQKMYDAGIPKTQLYKLHGNSIVINVLQEIFRKMFIEKQNENPQLELF